MISEQPSSPSTIEDELRQLRLDLNTMASELSSRLDSQTRRLENEVSRVDTSNALQRELMRNILLPNIAGIVGILLMQMFAHTHPALMICGVTFFLIMIALRCVMAFKIRKLNPYTDTVSDTLRGIISIKRFHTASVAVGLTMALPLLGWMLTVITTDYGMAALYGGLFGLVVGGTVGWLKCRKIRRLISEMSEQLKE